MTKKRRNHSAQFKFRVALEAIQETKTINEIASEYVVHPSLARTWKSRLQAEGATLFTNPTSQKKKQEEKEQTVKEAELYEQIGRLKMELEWLKKKAAPFS